MDAMVFLPDHYRLATQPAPQKQLPELEAARSRFERAVLAVFKVPDAFLTGATGGGISDKQSKQSSEHDVHRFRTGIDTIRVDLEHFCATVLERITGNAPVVKLPVMGLAKLEEIQTLYHGDVFEGDVMREQSARAAGIPVSLIKKGKKVSPPARLDKADKKPRESR